MIKHVPFLLAGPVSAAVLAACGKGGDAKDEGASGPDNGVVVSSGGQVVPNTFLEFQGNRYQLVEVVQADLFQSAGLTDAGAATRADIDYQGTLRVYRRAGETTTVYTYTPRGRGAPAVWLRWVLQR
jgi:hypothetical protein